MKVLVIGSGGREHALVWKIKQSPLVREVFCAPGNAGIALDGTCVDIAVDDLDGLIRFATETRIDLTVVGPELPLTLGIVDRFRERGLEVAGPLGELAKLEGSKAHTKSVLTHAGVATAAYEVFTEAAPAKEYVRRQARSGTHVVVKADGLAAGKGVVVCSSAEEAEAAIDDCLVKKVFGAAGATVVIEECLPGEEASFIVLTDGATVLPFPTSQDHKRLLDGDKGPNTGGMGAYSPAPVVTKDLEASVLTDVIHPTLETLLRMGPPYTGWLYAGLMIAGDTTNVLEFNVRMGDPETQPILMRLQSDLVPALVQLASGERLEVKLEWDPRPAVCVVMAAEGYPGTVAKGDVIHGLDAAARLADVKVFHAGTARRGSDIVTAGGRVLGVTALGADLPAAIARAYEAVSLITWRGAQHRTDIGRKALHSWER
ncbi:MAG: phosphoribosylamine--glycine ligase [Deltaproteobacteria bacterium]|nr:phosphoribosylamine--glycine ligase [Deltaproteobacteria bacterium]